MKLKIHAPKGHLKGSIALPASKSLSNRLLIIQALSNSKFELNNLSKSDDTRLLQDALKKIDNADSSTIDVGHAGTSFRFLTALLATKVNKDFVITGSQRMKERPCGILADALNSLGANIEYLENEKYPPLKIGGGKLNGEVSVAGNVSSQFISALMMIGPTLKNGLTINMTSELVSKPYLMMTKAVMEMCGAKLEMEADRIVIERSVYEKLEYSVESDWSAAAFWYEMIAIRGGQIKLKGLQKVSLQGDAVVIDIFKRLGVLSNFQENGIVITKQAGFNFPDRFEYDFTPCPDLVQAVVCACVALNVPFKFIGLSTLKIKETDRIEALKIELAKLNIELQVDGNTISYEGSELQTPIQDFSSYQDHRMAMSLAPLALCVEGICIEDPSVVSKSYPNFWKDLECVGFHLSASD